MVLDNLGRALDNAVRRLRGLPKVDKDAIRAVIQELQRALLSSDVKVELVFEVTNKIEKRAMDEKPPQGINSKEHVIRCIHDELAHLLGGEPAPMRIKPNRQNIILMVGIQGSGKTTTVGKLANYYKKKQFRVAVVCSDTWRPGAFDQLKQLAESIEVPIWGDPKEKNAIKLATKGAKKFVDEKYEIIIVDTAGRHKEEKDLMKEMQEIEQKLLPDETILVIDGTLGQQAYNQAKVFAETTRVGSIIVTKLDGSAKGGGALSAVVATGAPIRFIGEGEKIDALEAFEPTSFVGNLLGIPDIKGLLEKIKEAQIEPEEDVAKRFMKGNFTLDDLYKQMKALRKMGPIKSWISKLGGQNIPDEMKDVAEQQLDKWKVVLDSMTQYEKDNPMIIKKSRIARIATGSGQSYTEIKNLLKQYDQMKKMVKNMVRGMRGGRKGKGKGGMPGMPGMPGFPGMGPGGMKMPPGVKGLKKKFR